MPYYPESKYSKPKSTRRGQFRIKGFDEIYTGLYVGTFDHKYFAGISPMDTQVELEKIENTSTAVAAVLTSAVAFIVGRVLTKSEKDKGSIKRYFIQTSQNSKISETDRATYLLEKKSPLSKNFLEVDWNIKGPAEDKIIGQYKYEGAESKNKKTIQALEKQLPGISNFITDYKYLVQEPTVVNKQAFTSEVITEKDPAVELENSRKANFDTRK